MSSSSSDPDFPVPGHTSSSLSSLLLDFAANFHAERVRIRDIIESLGQRSFGFILLIFALPNSLPILGVPGVSTVTGLPMLLVAAQMALGHSRVYLPGWIADRSVATVDFQKLINKVAPWLRRIEKLTCPRITWLTQANAERLLGAFCVSLAVLLALPIPLGNLLPALGVLFIALGLIERDGVCVLVGVAIGVAAWIFLSGLIWVAVQTVITMLDRIL